MATVDFFNWTAPPVTGGPHTNTEILLTEDDFPAAMIDGGAQSIANGGGNFRAYTAADKITQLPLDVVRFVTGGTPDIRVWLTYPSFDTGSNIYIETDDAVTTQPAVGAAFGQHAVWSPDFHAASHDGLTDIVSGATILDDGSGASTTSPLGPCYAAVRGRYSDASIADVTSTFTYEFWTDVGSATGTFISRRDGSTHQTQSYIISGTYGCATTGLTNNNVGSSSAGWQHVVYTFPSATNASVYRGGAALTTGNDLVSISNQPTIPLRYGFRGNGGVGTVGAGIGANLAEMRVRKSVRSSAYYAMIYDNQSAVSSAWGTVGLLNGGGTPIKGVQFIWRNKSNIPEGNLTNISVAVYSQLLPGDFGTALEQSNTLSSAGNGLFKIDLDSTGVSMSDTVFVIAYDLDGTDHRNSQNFCGRLVVGDIQ